MLLRTSSNFMICLSFQAKAVLSPGQCLSMQLAGPGQSSLCSTPTAGVFALELLLGRLRICLMLYLPGPVSYSSIFHSVILSKLLPLT